MVMVLMVCTSLISQTLLSLTQRALVYLTDVRVSAQNQAIPRNKDSVKTGRMEGLLDEMRLMIECANADSSYDCESSTNVRSEPRMVQLPQFVYASTHEVYDRLSTANNDDSKQQQRTQEPNPPPFREDKPITTPSSLHGTAKLINEVLASAYHSRHMAYTLWGYDSLMFTDHGTHPERRYLIWQNGSRL